MSDAPGGVVARVLRRPGLLALVLLLGASVSVLLLLHRRGVLPLRLQHRTVPVAAMQPEEGRCWIASLGTGWLSAHERPSPARFCEDGRDLGPGNALHSDIREQGGGRFSVWHGSIYFSTSDGSSPRDNGRRYEVVWPWPVRPWVERAILGLDAAVLALLLYALARRRMARGVPLGDSLRLLPPLSHRGLRTATLAAFGLVLAAELPIQLMRADRGDAVYHQTVPTVGDDDSYTKLAINLVHGQGYVDSAVLPLETYHQDLTSEPGRRQLRAWNERGGPERPFFAFYRPPGFPLLMAATFEVFGVSMTVARRLLAVLVWLTAVALLLFGQGLAGWVGALAGGLAAVYHLELFQGTQGYERILTEVPAAFWIAAFALAFGRHLRSRGATSLVLAGIALTGAVFTRVNFLVTVPMLLWWLWRRGQSWRQLLLLAAIVGAPVLAWSGYASAVEGRPVLMSTQGKDLFATTNNADSLYGVGPDHWNQGGWNPGFEVQPDGSIVNTNKNEARPGESGWARGLKFWREHWTELPRLFYVKMRAGLWFNNGNKSHDLSPEVLSIAGIAWLLLASGLRVPRRTGSSAPGAGRRQVWLQLAFVVALCLWWNAADVWLVLVLWATILGVALWRPYGDAFRFPGPSPCWYLAFVASHAITTVVFYGIRFQQPVDPPLVLFATLGPLLAVHRLMGWQQAGPAASNSTGGD